MHSATSVRCLKIYQRPNKTINVRSHTPFRDQQDTKSKLQHNRNHSPESYLKLKSYLIMHEQIKRSATPAKVPEGRPQSSLKSYSKSKLIPINKKEITKLNLKESGIGDEYAKAMSSTVREFINLKELNVRCNRIADEGVVSLLSSLNRTSMKVLDLSHNALGLNSINTLVDMLNSFNSSVEKLCLESTRLTFKGLKLIIKALRFNHSLQEFNIASNKLGPGCGILLKELLSQTTTLKKIDLHWNLFKGQEGVYLLEGLHQNDTLKAVDLSWNSLGSEMCTIESLCWFLSSESQVEHLDISHNRISSESVYALSNAIKNNHTLLGLHLEGNYCTIDHLGFIYPLQEIAVSPTLQKSARILRTPRRINDNKCWICNKYIDFRIKWDPDTVNWRGSLLDIYSRKSLKQKELVYVHLEIDNYNPFLLESTQSDAQEIIRAVPRSKTIRFFYSYRGRVIISRDYLVEKLEIPIEKTITSGEGEIIELSTHSVNYIVLDNQELTCKPRPDIKAYLLEIGELASSIEWTLEKSMFANYAYDSDDILKDCFEFDWSNTKVPRIIKNDTTRDKIKEIIRPYYKYIRKTYRLYAAIGTNGSIFSINLAILTELCQKCEIFDKSFKISDVDLALKASKYSKSSISTAYGLVRHEFLEFLIRVALDKYYRSGLCKTESEAIEVFFQVNFIKNISIYDQDKWRFDRFFTQECEEILIENREVLQIIFDMYSGKKAKPGEKKYMLVDDFIGLCHNHGFISDTFNLRHATLCFHMALMTHVDEINSILHTEATRLEFTEALARVAEHFYSSDPEKDMVNYVFAPPALSKKLSEIIDMGFGKYRLLKRSLTRSILG